MTEPETPVLDTQSMVRRTEVFQELSGMRDVLSAVMPLFDEDNVISARRWCWRQSAASATRPETSEVLITVEGHHDGAEADVAAALGDLRSLLSEYQPDAEIASVAAFSPETGWQLLS